jgi:hypothetical protein
MAESFSIVEVTPTSISVCNELILREGFSTYGSLRIVYEPLMLRHFAARFEKLCRQAGGYSLAASCDTIITSLPIAESP